MYCAHLPRAGISIWDSVITLQISYNLRGIISQLFSLVLRLSSYTSLQPINFYALFVLVLGISDFAFPYICPVHCGSVIDMAQDSQSLIVSGGTILEDHKKEKRRHELQVTFT